MADINKDLVLFLNKHLEIDMPAGLSIDELKEFLTPYINDLINKDFNKLINILYRIDIDEKKLKTFLSENKDIDAASIISDMIIDRQMQKIWSRSEFKKDQNISDEEEW